MMIFGIIIRLSPANIPKTRGFWTSNYHRPVIQNKTDLRRKSLSTRQLESDLLGDTRFNFDETLCGRRIGAHWGID